MMYALLALVCAVIGVIPLFLRKWEKVTPAIICFVTFFFASWGAFYFTTPSTVYPLWGIPGFFVLIFWVIAAIVEFERTPKLALWPASFLAVYIVLFLGSAATFRANEYKALVGPMEERVWTQDVQPKDPKHIRMATRENASYSAKKILGEKGAIGSQFKISDAHMTLQMIGGELWYVVPLDYGDFSVWTSTPGVPGYVMVHGEDPYRQAIFKEMPKPMQYTPGAYFSYELERHLRSEGYIDVGLTGYTFQIDENGKAWWVCSTFNPTIGWSGEVITGVTIVDPTDGSFAFYKMGEIPDWIDRVVPSSYVNDYLDWYGDLIHGWVNSWWGLKDVTEPEKPNLIYSSSGQPEWVSGITSRSGKDDSLVGLVYTNSRTGKSVIYKVSGGATDAAVLDAVDKNSQVQFKKLHGDNPQLYNVYGTMASVVPLLNESHAFQGVAIVAVNNPQTVAVGKDQYEALREYEKLISRSGQQITLDKERELEFVEGVVDRYSPEVLSSGTVYYVYIPGVPHIFTGGSGDLSVKLPVTRIGDKVRIEFYASERDVVPMHSFDNLSLVLRETGDQKIVRQKSLERRNAEETRHDAKTVIEKINKLSPEEVKKLGENLPK